MAREIFNPNLALFVSVPEGGTTFQPNPNSIVQNDTGVSHLEFFKFVGRVVGKALYDGQLMDAYFTRSFYKHMLGQPLTYEVRGARGARACVCVEGVTRRRAGLGLRARRLVAGRGKRGGRHIASSPAFSCLVLASLTHLQANTTHTLSASPPPPSPHPGPHTPTQPPTHRPLCQDIEAVDPEYYKNLKWMLENDITDVLDLTFTAESDFFGKTEVVELVPGGRDIRVTEANKREYVNLIARHRMTTSIKAQIQVGGRVGSGCCVGAPLGWCAEDPS